MKNTKTVCILMSTYNGERYIREQLDSIFSQKDVDIYLSVRDDGSSDSTLSILKEYNETHDNMQIELGENVGVLKSFMNLLLTAPEYDYYAFSDQDDVWDLEKLSRTTKIISSKSIDKPILCYSDLKVVDSKLNNIKGSFFDGKCYNRYQILFTNYIPGCSMVFNSAMRNLALIGKYDNISTIHDEWLTWIASFLGEIIYDDKPGLLYRQHGNNVIGADGVLEKQNKFIEAIAVFVSILFKKNPRLITAREFYSSYKNMLQGEDRKIIESFINEKRNLIDRFYLIKNKDIVYMPSFLARAHRIAVLLFGR